MSKPKTVGQKNLQDEYERIQASIRRRVAQLNKFLAVHRKHQREFSKDWSLVGDLARVDFQLSEMYPLHRGQEKG